MARVGRSAAHNNESGRRRRHDIVDVAAQIFFEKGYDATSMQDVASAVGILKGSIYYYIDSKEDLLFSIIEDAHALALAAVEQVKAVPGNSLAHVYALVLEHVRVFSETRVKTAVFFREFRSLSPERQSIIRGEGDVYTTYLRALIVEAQGAGLANPDLDPKITSIGIIGMINSMLFWYRPEGPATPEQIGREFGRMTVSALASDRYLVDVGGSNALVRALRAEIGIG